MRGKQGHWRKSKTEWAIAEGQSSARQASYTIFWSQAHLSNAIYLQEIDFFNQRIKPLIATNYYRNIGEDGEFIDDFWLIDLPFIVIFGL